MAGKFNAKFFNGEVFQKYIDRIPNPRKTELLKSRAIRSRPELASSMRDEVGGNYISTPLKGLISGSVPMNYDGNTDITPSSTETFMQSRVVVGRANAWAELDFSYDITGGEDFMENVAEQINDYWNEIDQDTLVAILKGVFSMTDTQGKKFVKTHTHDVTALLNADGKTGVMDATTMNTAIQRASGDQKGKFTLVLMHSVVATNLENLKLLTYLKYNDVTWNTDPASAEAQWASDRIDELVQKFTSLYELSIETVEEFNQVNGADNIKMKNSIVVNAKLNLKLYAALSVILFLFLGCFCAIFLGRLGDFVDYYLYVDKKSGLPNRERCDAMVDRYSTVRLNGQFTVIHIQVDLSGMSRNDGDKALRALGDQLQYVFRTLGFVGYNGAGHFIVLLEDCSIDLARNCIDRLSNLLAKTELAVFGPCVFVGVSNSAKDDAYEIRALLRLAIRRCADAKARQEAENARKAVESSPLKSES